MSNQALDPSYERDSEPDQRKSTAIRANVPLPGAERTASTMACGEYFFEPEVFGGPSYTGLPRHQHRAAVSDHIFRPDRTVAPCSLQRTKTHWAGRVQCRPRQGGEAVFGQWTRRAMRPWSTKEGAGPAGPAPLIVADPVAYDVAAVAST